MTKLKWFFMSKYKKLLYAYNYEYVDFMSASDMKAEEFKLNEEQ